MQKDAIWTRMAALADAPNQGRPSGLTEQVGADRFFPTVRTAVAAFESRPH